MSERDRKYKAFYEDDINNNRGRIINACDEIKYIYDNPGIAETYSKNRLIEILDYATHFSNYYKKYADYKTLRDFPIVDKQVLKDNWDEILVSEYANMPDNCVKNTSGSTGTPFKLVLDRNRHSRWIAGNKVFRDAVGVRSHEKAFYYLAIKKNISLERQERDNIYYDYFNLSGNDGVNTFIDYLEKNEFRSFTMLASALEQIAQEINSGGVIKWNGKMIAVFSMSDALKESTRDTISKYFNCPVYDMYGNEECGVIASEDGTGLGFRANTADLYFEVLKMDSDESVSEGELGRLVVTDFFNKAFPLIRYDVGDIVSIKKESDGRLYITQMGGRKLDMLYDSQGRMVSYYSVIPFVKPYMDIKQFQLIQESYHDFIWVLNTTNHSYEDNLIIASKKIFGEDTNWRFEYVNEIPKLRSGKFRMAICKINDNHQAREECGVLRY